MCFGALKEHLPDDAEQGRAELDVEGAASVRDIVTLLGAPERLIHSVLVDGARVELSQELTEGAEVTLMPPFAGGSS